MCCFFNSEILIDPNNSTLQRYGVCPTNTKSPQQSRLTSPLGSSYRRLWENFGLLLLVLVAKRLVAKRTSFPFLRLNTILQSASGKAMKAHMISPLKFSGIPIRTYKIIVLTVSYIRSSLRISCQFRLLSIESRVYTILECPEYSISCKDS